MSPYCDPSVWDVIWHAALFGAVFAIPIGAAYFVAAWALDRWGSR